MITRISTIGELKEFIKDLSNDVPIVIYRSNLERSGFEKGVYVNIEKRTESKECAFDNFDGTAYKHTTYIINDSGEDCIVLS